MPSSFNVSMVTQRTLGLGLALAIIAAWLSMHIAGVFYVPLENAAVVVTVLLFQCWLNVGLFIIAHDCMHGSLAPRWPRVNTLMGTLSLALYAGFSYAKLLPAHHCHHRVPGTEEDPDFSVAHSDNPTLWFVEFVRRYFGLREFAILTTLLTLYLVVLAVPLERMLLFWALPAIASSMQLFFFGTYLPHRTTGEPFEDQHRARNNEFGYWGSLFSCYHFGFHHVHHLYPGVPWWGLPHVHESEVSTTASS